MTDETRKEPSTRDAFSDVREVLEMHGQTHHGRALPMVALLERRMASLEALADAVRQYQRRDETTLLGTFSRLMNERSRIAHMVEPERHEALKVERGTWEADARALPGCASPAEALIYDRGGFVPSSAAYLVAKCPVCFRPVDSRDGHDCPPMSALEESRALIERAAARLEEAGATDIAGALLLLAEVVTTRAGES